jgi:hypothetical protein
MNLATIIQEVQADGVSLTLSPSGTIKATGDGAAVNRWLTVIREHKAALVETLRAANDDTATSFAWLIHFTDRDPLPVSFSPEATHVEALASYPDAVAAEPIVPPQPIETSCRDCQHFKRPGKSSGYCGGHDDLPLAYGANHPLRKLPDDGGASCEYWQANKHGKGN